MCHLYILPSTHHLSLNLFQIVSCAVIYPSSLPSMAIPSTHTLGHLGRTECPDVSIARWKRRRKHERSRSFPRHFLPRTWNYSPWNITAWHHFVGAREDGLLSLLCKEGKGNWFGAARHEFSLFYLPTTIQYPYSQVSFGTGSFSSCNNACKSTTLWFYWRFIMSLLYWID